MRFSSAGRAEQDQVCAIFEPAVSGTDRHHLRLRYHRNRVEVERIERFSRQQFRLRQMPLHAAATAFGDLMLGDRAEEPRRRPALLVGTLGERRPELFDCRQRSEEHTSELQSLMRNSYAVLCLKKQQQEMSI